VYVFSLGGSVLFDEKGNYNNEYIIKFRHFLKEIEGRKIIVVGGGIKAREKIAKMDSKNNFDRDIVAIKAVYENANYFANIVGIPCVKMDLETIDALPDSFVTGGVFPGLTTDSVAALLAEKFNATFINVTNVDGIFTKDPKKYKDAQFLKSVKIDHAIEIASQVDKRKAGTHVFLDLFSLMIIKRGKIKTIICSNNLENLGNLIHNQKAKHTEIVV
jgi:uridylate kinase